MDIQSLLSKRTATEAGILEESARKRPKLSDDSSIFSDLLDLANIASNTRINFTRTITEINPVIFSKKVICTDISTDPVFYVLFNRIPVEEFENLSVGYNLYRNSFFEDIFFEDNFGIKISLNSFIYIYNIINLVRSDIKIKYVYPRNITLFLSNNPQIPSSINNNNNNKCIVFSFESSNKDFKCVKFVITYDEYIDILLNNLEKIHFFQKEKKLLSALQKLHLHKLCSNAGNSLIPLYKNFISAKCYIHSIRNLLYFTVQKFIFSERSTESYQQKKLLFVQLFFSNKNPFRSLTISDLDRDKFILELDINIVFRRRLMTIREKFKDTFIPIENGFYTSYSPYEIISTFFDHIHVFGSINDILTNASNFTRRFFINIIGAFLNNDTQSITHYNETIDTWIKRKHIIINLLELI